jgi:hypothetical protein
MSRLVTNVFVSKNTCSEGFLPSFTDIPYVPVGIMYVIPTAMTAIAMIAVIWFMGLV